MKHLLFALLLLISIGQSYGQGIQFVNKPWAELLATAKAENKLIFIDAYTTWCGPCKALAKNIFPQKAVGDAFNSKFINAQIDMEKGEGIAVANQYMVKAYPTLLFVDGNGNLIHKGVGYLEAAELIDLSMAATDPNRQLNALDKKYMAGNRDPEFLKSYINTLDAAYDQKANLVAEEFLQTQTDWNSKESQEMIITHASLEKSKMFEYLKAHTAEFRTTYGTERVDGILESVLVNPIIRKYSKDEAQLFPKVEAAFKQVNAEKAAEYFSNFKINYYNSQQKQAEYQAAVKAHMAKFDSEDYSFLNQIAWSFYEDVTDKKDLELAVKWAKKSVSLKDGYANNDTLAALYYKTGQNKKALAAAQHAIDLAKVSGEDYAETESLMQKMK